MAMLFQCVIYFKLTPMSITHLSGHVQHVIQIAAEHVLEKSKNTYGFIDIINRPGHLFWSPLEDEVVILDEN